MTIGAVEDAAKWGDPVAEMSLASGAGFGAVRMTMQWSSGLTVPSAGELQNTRAAADAARSAGIEPIVAIYNTGSSATPADDVSRGQFAAFGAAVASGLPSVQRFIVGNEPNLNRYWMPQFNADGSDAAAPAYELLLAATYDAIKAARPDALILGGALSARGEDSPTSPRPTHSPTAFIKDIGVAYRASGRTSPIMDVFDQHVYEDYSAMPPSFEHPNSTTIAVSDYGKLVSLLGQAFDGSPQTGSTLPIFYGEYGVESVIPSAKASLYSGTEPASTKAVDEPTQAALYRRRCVRPVRVPAGVHGARCWEPHVRRPVDRRRRQHRSDAGHAHVDDLPDAAERPLRRRAGPRRKGRLDYGHQRRRDGGAQRAEPRGRARRSLGLVSLARSLDRNGHLRDGRLELRHAPRRLPRVERGRAHARRRERQPGLGCLPEPDQVHRLRRCDLPARGRRRLRRGGSVTLAWH
jgi:hypothetical protein